MLSKTLFKSMTSKMSASNKIIVFGTRRFAELTNWNTDQPPKVGSWDTGIEYNNLIIS